MVGSSKETPVSESTIMVHLATTERQQREAEALIRRLYYRYYKTIPQVGGTLLVATQSGKVVGTTVVHFKTAGEDTCLPIEKCWQFCKEKTPWPVTASTTAQLSRLTATENLVSPAMTYAVACYGLKNGRSCALVETKEPVTSIQRKLGLDLREVPGAMLYTDAIAPEDTSYYCSDPPPVLHMVQFQQLKGVLSSLLAPALRSGYVVTEV